MILKQKKIEEILEEPKDIICFGSGSALNTFTDIFIDTCLVSKIRYVVDNDSAKWGQVIYINNREISIVSPDFFLSLDKRDIIALITLKSKDDILAQYQNIEDCQNLQAIWYYDTKREYCTRLFDSAKVPDSFRRSDRPLIPKVIHYCWFGKGDIPYKNRVWMESWEKYCPDYEIVQWNEDNYDVTKNQYMYEAYKTRRWGFATDYARLDIIYQNGGIYLDTDVELVQNLDELLYQSAFMGWEDDLRVNTGLGFGAVRGIELFQEMRDYYDDMHFINEGGSHDLTACPTHQTRVLQHHGLKKNGEYQIINGIAILPVTCLCGKAPYLLRDTRTEHTYGIHHFDGSWINI